MSRKVFQYDSMIGYRFVPGLKARIEHEGGGYLVRVNGAGFRCEHEFVPQKPAGVFRVLVFGDSFTAGDGVSNKDRDTDVLERLIEGVEVYNFGLSGTGTDQQYLVYREIGRTLEHDLVIMAVQIENIRRVAARYRAVADEQGQTFLMAKPYFTHGPDGGLTLQHVPPPKEPIHPDRLDPAQRLSRHQTLPELEDPHHPPWKLLLETASASSATRIPVRSGIARWPSRWRKPCFRSCGPRRRCRHSRDARHPCIGRV
jgi:hypothetical protein